MECDQIVDICPYAVVIDLGKCFADKWIRTMQGFYTGLAGESQDQGDKKGGSDVS